MKTQQFGSPKYVGDPLNAVRIFNEKEVDELIVLDIDATVEGREPDYRLIESLAVECRMPLCYGGGVTRGDQAQRIIQLGAEKVALSSALVARPELAGELAALVGGQSVVGVLDVRTDPKTGRFEVYTRNGRERVGHEAGALARRLEECGVGEIVVNSIDRDGMRNGYDLPLIERIREVVTVPMTALGGAGSPHHVREVIERHGVIGVAAGSLFVFKGTYRAVLISYPNRTEKLSLMEGARLT